MSTRARWTQGAAGTNILRSWNSNEAEIAMNRRRRIRFPIRATALALLAGATLAACGRTEVPPAAPTADEMSWARAALERNPKLEVLAVDADAKVFTVRDLETGEVQAVKLGELAATPLGGLPSAAPAIAPEATLPAAAEESFAALEAAPGEDAAAAAEAGDAAAAPEALDYKVERDASGLRVTGPGLSIVSAGAGGAQSARGEAGQQNADPLICEGARLMQFDNRRIYVDGDAITARGGCELHITNSRIVASGSAVVVQDASVHISNSYIEGERSAYHAGPGAKLFLRGTTLSGVRRRDAGADVRELVGGEFIPSQ
jgi:hypothetical protein